MSDASAKLEEQNGQYRVRLNSAGGSAVTNWRNTPDEAIAEAKGAAGGLQESAVLSEQIDALSLTG